MSLSLDVLVYLRFIISDVYGQRGLGMPIFKRIRPVKGKYCEVESLQDLVNIP